MRNSIPTLYALFGSTLSLVVGVVIGFQFSSSPIATTSNDEPQMSKPSERVTARTELQPLVDGRSEPAARHDNRELINNDSNDFEGELAQAFEQKKGLELQQKLLTVIDRWAAVDSKAAFDWLDEHSNEIGSNFSDLYSAIMSHHIHQAPESSKWTISEMNPSPLKNTLVAQLASALANNDPLQALQWSESLQDDDARDRAIEVAAQAYTEKNSDAALQYALSVSDAEVQQKMLHEVGFIMASIDPVKASNTLDSFSTETRSQLIPRVAWAMSQKDPEQATQWVNQIPQGNTRDEAIREASWGLVSANPEQAFRLISTVDDSAMRYALVRDALMAWHRTDSNSAQQALRDYPELNESQKSFLLRDLQQNAPAPDLVVPY